jgi:hypothetical protein
VTAGATSPSAIWNAANFRTALKVVRTTIPRASEDDIVSLSVHPSYMDVIASDSQSEQVLQVGLLVSSTGPTIGVQENFGGPSNPAQGYALSSINPEGPQRIIRGLAARHIPASDITYIASTGGSLPGWAAFLQSTQDFYTADAKGGGLMKQ